MAAIYSNGGNRWNILGFNFTKRDALSSICKISMTKTREVSFGLRGLRRSLKDKILALRVPTQIPVSASPKLPRVFL